MSSAEEWPIVGRGTLGGSSSRGLIVMRAYCLKCKTERDIVERELITMKNGREATKGICKVCGKSVFRIGSA